MEPSPSQAKAVRRLTRLDQQRRYHGITLAVVAAEASKTSRRGSVSISTVSKTIAGVTKSANVVDTLKRLIAESRTRRQSGEHEQSVA